MYHLLDSIDEVAKEHFAAGSNGAVVCKQYVVYSEDIFTTVGMLFVGGNFFPSQHLVEDC